MIIFCSSKTGLAVINSSLNSGGASKSSCNCSGLASCCGSLTGVVSSTSTGVWIDVFPLDGVEEDISERKEHFKKMKKLWDTGHNLRLAKRPLFSNKNVKGFFFELKSKFISLYSSFDVIDEHISLLRSIVYGDTPYYTQAAFMRYGLKECHSISVFEKVVLVPFEDSFFYAMSGFDDALREKYGDYLQLPPVEKRINHHGGKYFWKE